MDPKAHATKIMDLKEGSYAIPSIYSRNFRFLLSAMKRGHKIERLQDFVTKFKII